MAYGRGASLHDAADRGATRAPLQEGMPVPPQGDLDSVEPLYTHQEYLGRSGESPAERTLREGMNDHGRALEQYQKSQTPDVQQYPLDKDGDEEK